MITFLICLIYKIFSFLFINVSRIIPILCAIFLNCLSLSLCFFKWLILIIKLLTSDLSILNRTPPTELSLYLCIIIKINTRNCEMQVVLVVSTRLLIQLRLSQGVVFQPTLYITEVMALQGEGANLRSGTSASRKDNNNYKGNDPYPVRTTQHRFVQRKKKPTKCLFH